MAAEDVHGHRDSMNELSATELDLVILAKLCAGIKC